MTLFVASRLLNVHPDLCRLAVAVGRKPDVQVITGARESTARGPAGGAPGTPATRGLRPTRSTLHAQRVSVTPSNRRNACAKASATATRRACGERPLAALERRLRARRRRRALLAA